MTTSYVDVYTDFFYCSSQLHIQETACLSFSSPWQQRQAEKNSAEGLFCGWLRILESIR